MLRALERGPHAVDRRFNSAWLQHAVSPRFTRVRQLPDESGLASHETAPLPEAPRHVRKDLLHAAARHRIVGRKVGAAKKGRAIGHEEDGEGIAAQAGEQLHRDAVARRHVGALVSIDAHRHEQ